MPTEPPPDRLDPERYSVWFALFGTAGFVAGVILGDELGLALGVCGLGLLALACWSRADGPLLFGPFVRAELVRQSRRQRVHLWRTLILLLVAVPLVVLYLFAAGPVETRIPRNRVTVVAEGVFLFVFWHLFLIAASVTATFLTTAVSEDREAKRLDFLLVTDLRNREVVAGKAAARALGAIGYFVPVLPLVLVLPWLFGVSPALILYSAGFAALTIFSIAGVATFGSVMSKNKKQSGQVQAGFIFPYFVGGFALEMLRRYPAVWLFPAGPTGSALVTVGDVVEVFNAGNPIIQVQKLTLAAVTGPNLGPLAAAFPGYAAFHLGAGLLFFLAAVRRLRKKSAELAGEPPPPPMVDAAAKRPPVSDRPVIWKEMYAIPVQFQTRNGRRTAKLFGFLLAYVPATIFLAAAVSDLGGAAESVRMAARFGLPIIAWVAVAAAMNMAALAIAKERERDTLTGVLLTDLSPEEVVRQKFLGVLGATRGLVYWQLIVGVPAVLCGAFTWWAFLGLLVTQIVLTLGSVALGLVASAKATTGEKAGRAVAFALGGTIAVSVAGASFVAAVVGGAGARVVFVYALAGLVPPATLMMFGFAQHAPPGSLPYFAAGVVAGWVLNLLVAWLLWRWARRRFLRTCEMSRDPGPKSATETAPPVVDDPAAAPR